MILWSIEILASSRRVEFKHTQTKVGGQTNVLGLADIKTLVVERIESELARGTHGRKSFLLALGINCLPENVVHRNRVGRQQQGVVLPGPLGPGCGRASLVDALDPVHDVQDAFLANDRVGDHLRE